MRRLLIGSCIVALLGAAAPAMADDHRGYGHNPGIHNHLDRGKAMPPGHHKKPFLKADYRHNYHKQKHHKQHKRQRDQYSRYDRDHHRNKHRHSHIPNRYDGHRYHRDYRVRIGFGDHLPPEYRFARIIHDTHVLIDKSHR